MIADRGNPNGITRGMANVPMNAWYVVAGMEEVGEKLLSRRVCDIPLVLYRTSDGEPVALFDRCPHRWMPLSLGNRIGDEIQCLYHGFRFDPTGRCTLVPTQSSAPAALKARHFPVVDRDSFTWIWMGDADKADPALIPDSGRIDPNAVRKYFHSCYPIKADYLLLHENAMDVSHASFLHAGIFDDGHLAAAPFSVETGPNLVRVTREIGLHVPGESKANFFGLDRGRPVRQKTIVETYAPSLNVIKYELDYPDEPERPKVEFTVLAPYTPAGPRQCYAFLSTFYSWPVAASLEELNAVNVAIIDGDALAIEAIEERRDEAMPDDPEMNVRADQPAVLIRRMIHGMAAAEQNMVH